MASLISKINFKSPVFWLRFLAYAIPLGFLIYVLYWNYTPFGYSKTYTIDVGAENDMKGDFYLEESKYLSERKVSPTGDTYRDLNGVVYAVYKPHAVLRDTRLILEIEGTGIEAMPLEISDDYTRTKWDYSWNFTNGSIPSALTGNADTSQNCAYFDGVDDKLELPDSKDLFESEPFTVFAEWQPENNASSSQQIIGHYNWELWQNKDNVEFRVGRMDNKDGKFYSIKAPVPQNFFNQSHTALAIYSPSATNGYIDLYIDEQYAGRTYFLNSVIWNDYGNRNLTIGKSGQSSSNPFLGCIFEVKIFNKIKINQSKKTSFRLNGSEQVKIPLISTSPSSLNKIILYVKN